MTIQPPLISMNAEAGPSTPPAGRVPAYKLSQSLNGHRRSVTALQWSTDGQALVSGGADGILNIWTSTPPSTSLGHARTIRAHRTGINSLSISPDDLYVATASDDNDIRIYPVSSPSPAASGPVSAEPEPEVQAERKTRSLTTPLRELKGHTAPVLAVAFSPKSNLLVSGSFDESAIVWDVRRGVALRQLPAHSEAVWTVGWDGEGVMVLTGSADGLIRLWDATTGQCLKTLDNDSNSPVTSALFTPNPFYLISGTAGVVRVYNIHTGKVVKTLQPTTAVVVPAPTGAANENKEGGTTVGAVVVALTAVPESAGGMEVDGPGGKKEAWVLATTGESGVAGGKVVIWELGTRRVGQVLEGHRSAVIALAVHPSGRMVATGSLEPEKVIHVWRDDE